MWKKIRANIPNSITCLNLLSGCFAILMTMRNDNADWWFWPVVFIAAATLFDFLDGAVARLMKAYSDVGKELDSLSDLVSFGVAPSFMVYRLLSDMRYECWGMCAFLIAVLGAVRLARFNCDTRQTTSFIGLPIPANAIFWIGYVTFSDNNYFPGLVATLVAVVLISLLMVSSLPMFSLKFKNFHWRDNFRRYAILAAAVLFVCLNGLPGLMWTIIAYIIVSAVTARTNPATF